jgi:2-desacetyl-2-hydroxyethyl bacteriochlorophyllide A dehydrogenase
MKIAAITSGGFVIQQQDLGPLKEGEVLVQSISCGICEGDVYRYRQIIGSKSDSVLYLGHEGSGTVTEIGPDVTDWKIGDLVTTSLGGAYGEYFIIPQERLVRIPEGISANWAVGEAVACCAYSVQNARIRPGDKVAVVGSGFMGMLCAAFSKKMYSAGEVTVIEPIPWRLEMAKKYGADNLSRTGEDLPSDYYDVVIEAAGASSALDLSTRIVREHGRLTIVGYHQSHGGMRNIHMQAWNLKALEITSGHCRKPLWKKNALIQAFPLIACGEVDLQSLVTPYSFEDIQVAFEDILARKQGLMKAVVLF